MQEFIAYKLPNSNIISCFKGNWENSTLNNNNAQFWLQPFNNTESACKMSLTNACNLTDLNFSLEEFAQTNETETQVSFENRVNQITNNIDSLTLQKVVPARAAFYPYTNLNILQAFNNACNQQPFAFCYLLFHKKQGFWIGVSPELFVEHSNNEGKTTALAGTIKNNTKAVFTAKEVIEQQIVVTQIVNSLTDLQLETTVLPSNTAISGALKHIKNDIAFKCNLSLIPTILKKLHPSAAVGGFPRLNALQWLQNTETLNRGLYTGWYGLHINNTWFSHVNLRCAQIFNNGLYCYAGCGVSEGSIASKEWEETENKMTIIRSFF